jgi:hypothetical protein
LSLLQTFAGAHDPNKTSKLFKVVRERHLLVIHEEIVNILTNATYKMGIKFSLSRLYLDASNVFDHLNFLIVYVVTSRNKNNRIVRLCSRRDVPTFVPNSPNIFYLQAVENSPFVYPLETLKMSFF